MQRSWAECVGRNVSAMNERVQSQATPLPKPSFAPVRSNLLQRKCACGGTPGLDGECAECQKKRLLGSQRAPSDQADRSEVPRIVDGVRSSTDRSLYASTRASSEATFGHDFSKMPVHAETPASIQLRLAVSRLDDRSDLSAGTERIIYARWLLLETNFGEFTF